MTALPKHLSDESLLIETLLRYALITPEGVDRVRKIVENLREFTQLDGADWQHFNLERGLDSTLGILENELRGKAEVDVLLPADTPPAPRPSAPAPAA